MGKHLPFVDRERLKKFLSNKAMMPVVAAEEGRFILPVPDFGDGKGPILVPNIKELQARLRGSEGDVETVELEAGPQRIPTDGSNVIVINRVDEFVQLAFNAKLQSLIDHANGEVTRDVIDDFMSYARGYHYDPEKKTITFCKNSGFHNDVYNMPCAQLKKRYVRHAAPALSLEAVQDKNLKAGYYIKKPLKGVACFLSGAFQVRLQESSGGAIQTFDKGAMVNIPDDPDIGMTFIHPTDIDTCYTRIDGSAITDGKDGHGMPVYAVDETLTSELFCVQCAHKSTA